MMVLPLCRSSSYKSCPPELTAALRMQESVSKTPQSHVLNADYLNVVEIQGLENEVEAKEEFFKLLFRTLKNTRWLNETEFRWA